VGGGVPVIHSVARGGPECRAGLDFGDHEHRDVAPDDADPAEHLDAGVFAGALVDFLRGLVDLAREVVDQRKRAGYVRCTGKPELG